MASNQYEVLVTYVSSTFNPAVDTWGGIVPGSPYKVTFTDDPNSVSSVVAVANVTGVDVDGNEVSTTLTLGVDYSVYQNTITFAAAYQGTKMEAAFMRTSSGLAGPAANTANYLVLRSVNGNTPASKLNTTKIALQAQATQELNGQVGQLSCRARQQCPVWTGAAWVTQVTRNPAWIFRWLLTSCPANPRLVATSRVDDASIIAWGSFCDAKGFKYDTVVDARTTIGAALREACAAGRASLTMVDNRYGVVLDQQQATPVQHFTPRNSRNFKGARAFVDQVHGLRVNFLNPGANYQQDQVLVFDDGYTIANATDFETLDLKGVTDADQAWRIARYHMAVGRLRPNDYSFETDAEFLVCRRGDLVKVNHDVVRWGTGSGRARRLVTGGENMLLYSQQLDVAGTWPEGACSVTANAAVAPDGTNTADKIVENTAVGPHQLSANFNVVSGEQRVFSVYLKAAGRTEVRFNLTSPYGEVVADLAAGTVSGTAGDWRAIQALGGGWYRVSFSATPAFTGGVALYITMRVAGNPAYVGDGASGVYVWGAQMERASSMGKYVPTAAASVDNRTNVAQVELDERLVPADMSQQSMRWRSMAGASLLTNVRSRNLAKRSSLTFARASTGTYLAADGSLKTAAANAPRYEYDAGGLPLGLLMEGARTNSVLQSQDFTLGWTWAGCTFPASTMVCPDGLAYAQKFSETAGTQQSGTYKYAPGVATIGSTYTSSFFLKKCERKMAFVACGCGAFPGDVGIVVDLSTGKVVSASGSAVGYGVVPYPNGWYRVWVSVVATTATTGGPVLYVYDDNQTASFPRTVGYGLYVWGAQYELGSGASSYAATTTAAVTRGADKLTTSNSMSDYGFDPSQGTFVVEGDTWNRTGDARLLQIDNVLGGGVDRMLVIAKTFGAGTSTWSVESWAAGVGYGYAGALTAADRTPFRIALSYDSAGVAYASNGGAPVTQAVTLPLRFTTAIGSDGVGAAFNGHLRRVCYVPTKLTGAALQSVAAVGAAIQDEYLLDVDTVVTTAQVEQGDLVMVGVLGQESVSLIVNRIVPGQDLSATIYAVDEAPVVYTADAGPPPVTTEWPAGFGSFQSDITGTQYEEPPDPPQILVDYSAPGLPGPGGSGQPEIVIDTGNVSTIPVDVQYSAG